MKKASIAVLFGLFVAGCGSETPKPVATPTMPMHNPQMMQHAGMQHAAEANAKREADAAGKTDDKATEEKPAEGEKPADDKKDDK